MEIVLEAGSDILSQAYMLDTLSSKAALPLRNTIVYEIYRQLLHTFDFNTCRTPGYTSKSIYSSEWEVHDNCKGLQRAQYTPFQNQGPNQSKAFKEYLRGSAF